MSWRQALQRLRRRDRAEDELDAELRDHVERQVADYVRAGMPAREARRRARLEFGGLDQVKELCRDARGARWIEDISRDLRYACRRLARDRSLAALAITTLGLGIGLNVAVFAMVHAIFVRGLPYDDPGRIVNVWSNGDRSSRPQRVSLPDFEDYRRAATTLAGLAAFTVDDRVSLSDAEHAPEPLNGSRVTANTFRLLGQPVLLGRDFLPVDGRRGAERTVILGHRVWHDRYAADPNVVGRVVRVDGEPATVIGVMPEAVRFPFRAEIWRALQPTGTLDRRDARRLATVGRLRPGVDLEEAQAELRAIAGRLRLEHPETNESTGASVQTFNGWATGSEVRAIYLALMGAVAFVLLIACANVANLLIARSAQRAHEVAIRLAQGATRLQIVRQLSIESLLLGSAGAIAGLGVAAAGVRLAGFLTRDLGIPPWMTFTIDTPILTFLAGLCILTTLLFGLAPLLHLAGAPVGKLLQEGGRAGTHGIRARRLSAAMIVVEAALALVLLGGTGLMLRSLDKMYRMDLGFDPERVLQGEIVLPSRQYADPEEQIRFATQLQRDLNASLGVRAASIMRTRATTMVEVAGRPAAEELPADVVVMSAGSRYFEVLGARVLRGRALTDDDGHAGAAAVVVNERFAALFFGAEDALGRRIRIRARDDSMGPWLTIVGIGSNVRVGDVRSRDWTPVVHLPYRMDAGPSFGLHVLTEDAPRTFVPQLRAVVRALDRDLPVHNARSMAAMLAEGRWWYLVLSGTLGVFALFAVVLAAVGIYAVAACAVAQRTREIGIRIALGAQAHRIVRTALGRVLGCVGIGLLLGLAGALAVGRVIESLLIQVPPVDPPTLVLVPLLFAALVAVACAGPVRRAVSLDPSDVLRFE